MKGLLLLLVSSTVWAQAEPAPESYRPPNRPGIPQPSEPTHKEEQARLPKWHISVAPHLDFLVGDVPPGLPLVGYGAGVQVARALLPIGLGRFGVAADFAYDRFSHDKKTSTFTSAPQYVGHATFAGMLLVDGIVGRFRPWLGLGGGFSVANYESPTTTTEMGVSRVGVVGLVKVAAGLGVRVYEGFDVGLRVDYDATFSSESVSGKEVWQPGFASLSLDLGYRF